MSEKESPIAFATLSVVLAWEPFVSQRLVTRTLATKCVNETVGLVAGIAGLARLAFPGVPPADPRVQVDALLANTGHGVAMWFESAWAHHPIDSRGGLADRLLEQAL